MGWLGFTFLAVVLVAVDYTIASTVLPVLLGYEGTAENAWWITSLVIIAQAVMIAFSTKFTQNFNAVAVTIQLVGMMGLLVLLFAVGAFNNELDFSNLFSTGTLLPAIIYAVTVLIYAFQRGNLPPSQGFRLGAWETPVLIVAIVWLVFELAIFRDASFAKPWSYVAVMFAIGVVYLVYLIATRGGFKALKMPDVISVDAILDADKGAEVLR